MRRRKAATLKQYAENARQRAADYGAKAHRTFDMIPPGQPIMGHTDTNRRERAWANIGKAAAESRLADALELSAQRAESYERRLEAAQTENLEPWTIGDTVIASFTNSYRVHRFRGLIVGRVVNSWKVKTLGPETPYDEAPGRVFAIPALARTGYGPNNRIIDRA